MSAWSTLSGGSPVPRPRSEVLVRPRLDARLDAAVLRPVTLVTAAAGTGKTTAVATWAAGRRDVRWYAPARHRAPASRAGAVPGHREVLVVDDADTLDPAALADLLLATQGEAAVHLVLLGRGEPPGARWDDAPDLVRRLRTDDLLLDDREAATLVHRLLDLAGPDAGEATPPVLAALDGVAAEVAAVVARCQGWAQLLVLAARSLARSPGGRTDETRLLDWVDSEVLDPLPLPARLAALVAAVPSPDPGRVAAVLADDPAGPGMLDGLVRDGLLRHDGAGWTGHPVLLDALLRRTGRGGADHADAVAAHTRAAAHLGRHGTPAAALRHAVRARVRRPVADLLLDHGIALVMGGEEDLVDDALDVVAAGPPTGEDDRSATLLLGVGGMLLRAQGDTERATHASARAVDAARGLAADLLASGRRPGPHEAAFLVDAACLHAWSARFGWADVPDALAATASVLGEPLGPDDVAVAPRAVDGTDPTRLCLLLRETAALETWAGRLDRAAAHTDRALVTAEAVANARLRAAALADRCLGQVLRGELGLAARTAQECLDFSAVADRPSDGYLSRPRLALGFAAFYDMRLADARAELDEARRILARVPEPLLAGLAVLLEVWLTAAGGDVVEARRLLADAPPLPEAAPPLLAGAEAFIGSQLALLDGDLDTAARLGEQLRQMGSALGGDIVVAGILEARGDPRAAAALLAEVLALQPSWGGEEVAAVLAGATLARLQAAVGDRDAARRRLGTVVRRAARRQLVQPVLMGLGPAAEALLTDLRDHDDAYPTDPSVGAVLDRSLLVAGGRTPRDRAVTTAPAGVAVAAVPTSLPGTAPVRPAAAGRDQAGRDRAGYVPPLTDRETDVLRGLALGESYADVAASLHLSENTVKTHVASLYRKLGAGRRSAALRRARELGLL